MSKHDDGDDRARPQDDDAPRAAPTGSTAQSGELSETGRNGREDAAPPEVADNPTAAGGAETTGAETTDVGVADAGAAEPVIAGGERVDAYAVRENDAADAPASVVAEEIATEPTESAENSEADSVPPGRRRLIGALWPLRTTRSQVIVAILLFLLGLGVAVQVRSSGEHGRLRGARQEDLVRILDSLGDRHDRLESEQRALERSKTELRDSSDQAAEARRQTARKAGQLAILAGTKGARGPGITVRVEDTGGKVKADMLLDALQELRAAGAEAVQINDVRVVANTYFTDASSGKGVRIDGQHVQAPYTFKVIGSAKDLTPALNIPGGVESSLEKEGASVSVQSRPRVVIDALRAAKSPN